MPALAVFVFLVPVRAVAQTNTVLVANTAGTPIPTVGAGYTVVQSPHVDINVSYHTNNATFSLGFRNDSGGTQYNGTNAIAYAVTNQRTTVPSGLQLQWAFLGPVGGTFWSFPTTQNNSASKKALYLGFAAYGVPANTFTGPEGGQVRLRVHSIENLTTPGSGHFFAYETAFSSPIFKLSSVPNYDNDYEIFSGGHGHLNLALTASGMFRVWFVVSGVLLAGGQTIESQPLPLYFGVEAWQIPSGPAPATGYEAWKLASFSSTQAADPMVSGLDADPDGDGANNLVEYAFNGNPLIPGVVGKPQRESLTDGGQEYLAIRYQRRKGDTTLSTTVESTADLSATNWSGVGVEVGAPTPVGMDYEEVVYRAPVSKADAPKQFMRVRVLKE